MSRLHAVLEAGRAHREATGARDDDGPVYRTWARASARELSRDNNDRGRDRGRDRERDRDRDRGVLSQFEQLSIRNGECITLEVPEFRYWDSVQVVPPGRYPMTKELVLALANAHIKEYTLEVGRNGNDPHFSIDEDHNRFIHSVRNVVPAGLENRQRAPPRRGEPGYDSDDLYS